MAHAIWSGSISFGLINIPVKLYSAITERSVRFNQIDTRNGARVKYRKVNAEDGEEVPAAAIAKGYEISSGRYVLVTEDDLASLQPRATHTIDLEDFIDFDDIDPIYFDGAYHVVPEERAAKAYTVLVRAMESAGKVAVARFVMRSKQYVAAMRPTDGRLVLSMLVYNDELNPASQIADFDAIADITVSDRELAMAAQLIESLSAEWDPTQYRDTFRDDVLALIQAKNAGEDTTFTPTEAPADDTVIDLMAALEASIAAAQKARDARSGGGTNSGTSSESSTATDSVHSSTDASDPAASASDTELRSA